MSEAKRFPRGCLTTWHRRLVVMNAVPLLPGYRWHLGARIARTPILGELATAVTTRPGWRFLLGRSQAKPSSIGAEMVQRVAQRYDRETRRTVLDLYRSAPPEALAQAGERLHETRAPVLVLWGEADPNINPSFAQAYAARFSDVILESYADAGHWRWLDRPELVDRVVRWLSGP